VLEVGDDTEEADGRDTADALAAAAGEAQTELDALAGVGGADFGNALHALFEHRAVGASVTTAQALIALREHGVRVRHVDAEAVAEAVAVRLNRVLMTPLYAPDGVRLWDLGAQDQRAEIGLTYIYGIGLPTSQRILQQTNVNPDTRVRDLTEDQVNRLREVIDRRYKVEGDLRREVALNIKRLIEIGSYRGLRHRRCEAHSRKAPV